MNQKTYSAKELNDMIGYNDISQRNSSKKDILRRCKNAGLIVEALNTARGLPNQYIIIENNFYIPNERWTDCYANEEWEVSDLGRVRNKKTKRLMGSESPDGYLRVCSINEKGKTYNSQLNRLVYFSFHPELLSNKDNIQIDHINGKRNDNKLDNLRALTNVENTQARDENQTIIKTLTTKLIIKFGYEKTTEMLEELLTDDE